ncbi:MAG: 5-formyltetrahydrofolate cyclo-ligase [Gammaproteobacteria bacterium HGW-Gammaproteobacteria-3]|nr:MAG: 5-formyltetrahydrofolate cyclo-ligase [Gammaproteobacteria bacterium HGW-Gammaproteobacteria-3]
MNFERKTQQRRKAYAARAAQRDKETLSRCICKRFIALPAFEHAQTVLWYLHCRSEVRTHETVLQQLSGARCTVIPYCTEDTEGRPRLGLWRLQDRAELVPGMWGILEPPKTRWGESGKEIEPEHLDMIMVPGVAFDRQGGRLGNGAGYYDRLLSRVRADCIKVGVAYEAQLMPEIFMAPHDIYMDYVLTEQAVYPAKI